MAAVAKTVGAPPDQSSGSKLPLRYTVVEVRWGRQTDVQADGQVGGLRGKMTEQVDKQTDTQTQTHRHRQIPRQTHRHTDRQAHWFVVDLYLGLLTPMFIVATFNVAACTKKRTERSLSALFHLCNARQKMQC